VSNVSALNEPKRKAAYEGPELFKGLGDALSHLWHLWELVLLNEPLIVEACDPSLTSSAVLALIELISPLAYCGDFRPYFTIYDRDYQEYAKAHPECLPGAIIGVTNPHLSHALAHWPHVLRLGGTPPPVLIQGNLASGLSPQGGRRMKTDVCDSARSTPLPSSSMQRPGPLLQSAAIDIGGRA